MPIKSFRGKIASGNGTTSGLGVETINLHTNNGSVGYRIKKFEVIGTSLDSNNYEATVKIYTIPQTLPDHTIDFSDNTLLGSAFFDNNNSTAYVASSAIIFDNMTFNQDIYVTNREVNALEMNYYIELEIIKLALDENTVATLKDIRNIESQ
tara:strand:+ start:15 stop:470 length:456 start_codon:yes stop_codon:yes gene_type:complete